jgi:predicted nuclease of predicted toxin-antitoxin system
LRILIDENMSSRRLAARLLAAGHDVVLAADEGLLSVTDARVFAAAIGAGRLVLTRDHSDFADLHDLIQAAGGRHPGILIVRFDNDPRHNLSESGIERALAKIEAPGAELASTIHVLNHWR